jgi:hypothetical protein
VNPLATFVNQALVGGVLEQVSVLGPPFRLLPLPYADIGLPPS